MGIYRANASDGVAWVTGASSGIGRQIALELAQKGYTVAATARRGEELAGLAAVAAASGGRILPFPGDVTDAAAMQATVEAIEAEAGPVALAVLNAGAYFPLRGDALDIANLVKSYELNVFGAAHGLAAAVEKMMGRGRGHVVLMGSASAYRGLPMAAAYGASKAALNHMAQSLKFDLDTMNIRIQVANPGFVATPLTRKARFPMPAMMDAASAARRIVRGIEAGGFEIAFPRRLVWPLKLARFLPHAVYFALLARFAGRRPKPKRRSGERDGS